jgi:hypothetical protein
MSKYFIGLLTGLAGLAAGGWLIAAPFALGYQPENANWVDATKVDFITGIVLAVLALAIIVVFALAARERLFELGALTRRVRPEYDAPTPAAAAAAPAGTTGTDLQALLAPLIAAMTADQQAAAGQAAATQNATSQKEPQL